MPETAEDASNCRLSINIDDQIQDIEFSRKNLVDGKSLFEKMDQDMNKGWQLGRHYLDHPNTVQRCQIACERLLTAIETNNQHMVRAMSGFVLYKLPNTATIVIHSQGEADDTCFYDQTGAIIQAL